MTPFRVRPIRIKQRSAQSARAVVPCRVWAKAADKVYCELFQILESPFVGRDMKVLFEIVYIIAFA